MSADLPRIRMMLNYFSTLTVWDERRIDTHRDNKIMQHNITKHSFTYCGIIYLLSGDERLAYQYVSKASE